jgi:hypothetical protein
MKQPSDYRLLRSRMLIQTIFIYIALLGYVTRQFNSVKYRVADDVEMREML